MTWVSVESPEEGTDSQAVPFQMNRLSKSVSKTIMPLSAAVKTVARRPAVVLRGTENPSPVAADVVVDGLYMKDCKLILNSGSDGRFAEIDPFRYGVESDCGVDVSVAAEAVDVDAYSSA